jgi:tetratricopeptide (TPR) repeat protein
MKLLSPKSALLALVCITSFRGEQTYAQVNISQTPRNHLPALSDELRHHRHSAVSGQVAVSGKLIQQTGEIAGQPDLSDEDKANYNAALGKLGNNAANAASYAQTVLSNLSNPAYQQRLSFALAQYYFKLDKFPQAIAYYEMAGINNLDNDEVGDQKFELAYSYFNNKQLEKARPLFSYIKDLKGTRYYTAGNYYYGLLCYNENKYDEALRSFFIIREEKDYKPYVPYYIAEIYYFKGDRKRALALTDSLLSSKDKSYYDRELHLLAAQCLFEDKDYARARPYFEHYFEKTPKIAKEDLYKMAYTYYRLGEWKNATEKFKMLNTAQDSLGQTSMYLLGDCYLKTGSKLSARNAFGICADMTFNKAQQEAAMILYARLSYETGNHDEALRMTNTLLTTFPNSQFGDEANTLKSDLLLKTNKYEEALRLLRNVKVRDGQYGQVYQKTAYGYAVQQYRKGDLVLADEYFANSLTQPVSAEYERAAYFWRGEIAYTEKRYQDAITYSQNFVSRIGDMAVVNRISPQSTLNHAYITMGYSAMETGNFVAAQDYFSQAQKSVTDDRHSLAEAAVLEADAVFLQKNYTRALSLYEKIIAGGGSNGEYATFQKGILLGLLNRNSEKLTLMQQIAKSKPASAYALNARYEISLTHMDMEAYKQALPILRYLYDSSTDQSFAARALMKTGFAMQQMSDNTGAIAAYRKVVLEHPGAEERFAALEALKGLYVQINQPGKYAELLSEGNLPSGDSTAVEAAWYSAGESQFAAGKWQDARRAFSDYLLHYPKGMSSVRAHYYLAECNYRLKKYGDALEHYNKVLETPWNDFSESSAIRAGAVAMELKNYESAWIIYNSLRSNSAENSRSENIYRGLLKSAFNTARCTETNMYADTLLNMPGVSSEGTTEARFYKARCLQATEKGNAAIEAFRQIASNRTSEIAAESRYRIAEVMYQQGRYAEAEETANESIRLSSGYDTWVGKSYLLLSDVLVKQKDYFNAKALLQSIVKNTKSAELKQEASRKLDEVKKLEKQQSKLED